MAEGRGGWGLAARISVLWRGGSTRPGSPWLLAYGLSLGFVLGALFHLRFGDTGLVLRLRSLVFGEQSLVPARPVTPPPPGHSWALALTTGYCPCSICCGDQADGHTATNRPVSIHVWGVAADPKVLPYGTGLLVPGYGWAEVDDTGGAMRRDAARGILHLDLRFSEHRVARRWGRRWLWIAVPADSAAVTLEHR